MSAGICGKRLGFEEIFGSPASPSSQAAPPSAKRSRCSPGRYGSPVVDLAFGSQDRLVLLLAMFPSVDPEVVENVLNAHDHNIDDAIKSLHSLSICDMSTSNSETSNPASALPTSDHFIQEKIDMVASEEKPMPNMNSNIQSAPLDGSSWVEIFVKEMTTASSWDDVRMRVTNLLEAFERNVITNCKMAQEKEFSVLKEQLQSLLRENQILKRAVAIQHERNLENDAKLQEVEQLKIMINQYQEQVRTLELNNYSLRIHLQKAQDASSIPNRFHPDIL